MNEELNIINEEYDPSKHCCEYWYKDFCDCYKKSRELGRQMQVSEGENFLNKNNIKYIETNISNVVKINLYPNNLYISLKVKNHLIKCRFENNSKWYLYSKDKFLKLINKWQT